MGFAYIIRERMQTFNRFTKREKPEPNLSDELLQEKIEIIHQILEDDDQIRVITEPWMIRLQEILCANGYNRNL